MPSRLLTDFELMILLAILRLGEEAYGVPVAREIEAVTGRQLTRAAVYTALDRLERTGLVTSTLGDPTPQRGGRAKRFLRVTGKGLRAVRHTKQAFTALWNGIPALKRGVA